MALINSYNFKEGAGVTLIDKVAGAADGTLQGASLPVWSVNDYLKFTGGNGASVGDWNRVVFSNENTFKYAWNNNYSWYCIFRSSKNDNQTHFICNMRALTGVSYISISLTTLEQVTFQINANTNKIATIGNVCDGKWHHAVLTYSQNSMICYVDNKVIPNTTDNNITTGNFYSATSKMTLGALYDGVATDYSRDLTGDIGLFMNFNHKLTAAEVSNYYSYYKGFF